MLFRPKRWQVILAGIVVPSVLIGGLKWFVFEWAKDYLFGKLTEETEEVMTSAVGEVGWEATLEWVAAGSLGLLIAIVLMLVGYFFRGTPRATSAPASSKPEDKEGSAIGSVWSALAEKDPANTLVILSAGIERGRLQGNHPAWEIFFTAYNGGVGEIRLVSAKGSFKVGGQAYPTPAELKSATPAKHGEITVFTVRQWIDQQDVPQGENHVVLQLSELRIEAVATDPVSGNERQFTVSLPNHLQFDVQHHWNIQSDYFSWFHRERFGTDDNGAAQAAFSRPNTTKAETAENPVGLHPDTPVYEAVNDWLLDQSQWGIGRNHNQALGELRQVAHNGEIAVWGRRWRTAMDDLTYDGTDPPITQISKEYWLDGDFDPIHCLMKDAPNACRTQPDAGIDESNFTVYQDVQVNKYQLESKWPLRDKNGARKARARNISDLYAQAVKLRNRAFSLRVLDTATESRINEIQEQLTEQMRDLAPERSINLETINMYNEGDHPPCVLQEPSRTRAMVFSEVLFRVKKILEDYK